MIEITPSYVTTLKCLRSCLVIRNMWLSICFARRVLKVGYFANSEVVGLFIRVTEDGDEGDWI